MPRSERPTTPDGRYFVARGWLRRCTDPSLPEAERRAALKALMQARHGVGVATEAAASAAVEAAKRRLGEAGPVWWHDGAPDESGLAPEATRYADWWAALPAGTRAAGLD